MTSCRERELLINARRTGAFDKSRTPREIGILRDGASEIGILRNGALSPTMKMVVVGA